VPGGDFSLNIENRLDFYAIAFVIVRAIGRDVQK